MNRQSDKLPAGWKWAALGEIILGKPQYGSAARKVPYNGKVRYVRITDLTDRGELKPDDPVSPSVVQPDRFLEPGDLLIARSGSVGRTYLHGNLPGTYQYAGYLIRFRIDPAKSLPGYVFYVSKSDLWREWIVSNSKTSTLTNINAKQYSSFRLPLPPLSEQKRIAALLNQQMAYVEKARQAAEEILEAAQALPGAFLRQAFPAHGEALPAGWQWTKLGDVCKVNPRRPTGFDWDPHTKTTFVPMPSVDGQTGAITQPQERNYAEVSRGYTYFEEGDVLFAKITPCMQNGKHAIASGLGNGFGFGSTEFHVLRPSGAVLSEWVHKFLRQPSVLAEAVHHFRGSVGQQRVPKEFLTYLPIPLPPLTEQKRIAALLNQQMAYVETVRMSAREQLDAINALPAALLRRAFAGTL